MTRYVFDTNQIVAAGSGWLDRPPPVPDPVCARRLLIHVAKNATGLYCGKMVGEYLEKLIDRKHPPDRALRFIQFLLGTFERVEVVTKQASHPPSDPDDEIFILCAVDGKAEYLISHDEALLNLAQHYSAFTICKADQEAARLEI
jgi:predicted nucleic acid-binding protein